MLSTPSAVVLEGVCYSYGGPDVLHDVSATFAPGEVTAVAGPNGSGKSTLVEVLSGVLRPRRGRIERAGDLALVVQRPHVPEHLPLTARDVVAMGTWRNPRMGRRARSGAVDAALDRLGMSDRAATSLHALSGGQRQRVFLAQGIVANPDVLVLDEPSAGLDVDSVARTQVILAEEARRGAVVVCVTHDDDAIDRADRVVRLSAGAVVAGRGRPTADR